jgi:5,10-methylenetetrahydromethanopterin reductase
MDYGIAGVIGAESWKTVQRAEQLGFSHAWFYDSPLYVADILVAMAAAAMQTSRIRLGMGVAVLSTRLAPTLADGLASLNKLAPGRIDCGIGTGNTARSLMGVGALKLAEVREYVRVVRGLLAGEVVKYEFEGAQRKLTFMHPVPGLVNMRDPIQWHMSAMGPRSRRLAAELGMGWINFMTTGMPAALTDLADMLVKWKAAGREAPPCYTTVFTLGCVLTEKEPYDSPRAKAQAGPLAAMVLHNLISTETEKQIDLGTQASAELRALVAQYQQIYEAYEPRDARYMQLHRGHLMRVLPEEDHLISGDLIRQNTFTGTVADLRERIRTLRDAGYCQLTIQLVPGHEDALDDWARVIEGV